MIRFGRIFLAILAMAFVGGCSSGVQSKSLSRSAALTLLNRWDQISDGDFNHRVKISYPVQTVIGPLNDPSQGKLNQLHKSFWVDAPVTAGVATIKSAEPYSDAGHPVGSTQFTLALVPQPGVAWAKHYDAMGGLDAGTIDVQLSATTAKEVTGVQQQGTNAVVDAVIVTAPTRAYEKLRDAAKSELALCNIMANRMQLDYCMVWPTEETFSSTQNKRIRFARYDDGWRVEGWE